MRPQLSILSLIAFLSFLFMGASQATQDDEKQPEMSLEYDMHHEWSEFMSLFNPANIVDKIQKAPFVSNLLGTPLTVNADKPQPGVQASPNSPDSEPELLQRSLEVLFSKEIDKIIRSSETMINSTVALGMAFQDILESASSDSVPSNSAQFTLLLEKVATFVVIARDDVRARFPLPATAPGHAERAKYVSEALEHLQQLVIRLARDYEIEQEVVEHYLARVEPFLHDAGVLIGDVAELYPAAVEALVLNVSAVLLPEALFLRSLVILYCFGPYVLGKDAISGWLLKHVSEALRA